MSSVAGEAKEMARPSMPADPVDDQLQALRAALAQTKGDLETAREEREAWQQEAARLAAEQKEQTMRWTLERRNLLADRQCLHAVKVEREQELAYLQGQLEVISGEKQILKDTIIGLEARVDSSRALSSQLEALKEETEALKEQAEVLQEANEGLQDRVVECQSLRDQIADLQHQLELSQKNEAEENRNRNHQKAIEALSELGPVGPPAVTLARLHSRLEDLVRSLQAPAM